MATTSKISITELENRGDRRGFSCTVPADALKFLVHVKDIHVASILPGTVRGNHFYARRRKILILTYTGEWSFHWDEGPGTPTQQQEFQGTGTVLITIEPHASHAVRNDGDQPLTLMAVSSEPYDPKDPVARRVI